MSPLNLSQLSDLLYCFNTEHETTRCISDASGFLIEGIKIMSVTGNLPRKTDEETDEMKKEIEKFLKKGGKIKKIEEGEFTEAKDMKYKFRKPAFPKKKKED